MVELKTGLTVDDRYRLQSEMGMGGFGTVWSATDAVNGGRVAIKFLRSADHTMRRRFEIEARALSRLKHPACVRVLNSGHVDGGPDFLVMELAEGVTLQERVETAPMVTEDVIAVARQIAQALVAAHREGIIHRDLKPTNVMVVTTAHGPDVKVLDFGIAKILGREQPDVTKTGEVLGTPGYMSPEQLRGRRDIGPATDLYALGVLMFTMFERRPPFTADTPLGVCMGHLLDAPPSTSNAPAHVKALIARLLSKDPRTRPGAAHVVRVLEGGPLPPLDDAADRLNPTARHVAALVIFLLAVVAAGIASFRSRGADPLPERPPPRYVAKAPPREPAQVTTPGASSLDDANSPIVPNGCRTNRAPALGQTHPTMLDGLDVVQLHHYVPTSYRGTPTPLVVVLGHSRRTPTQSLDDLAVIPAAEAAGFIVIAPSFQGKPAWSSQGDHDLVLRAIDRISDQLCVDQNRIYLLGHEWGAFAADQLTCQHPERFAGFVSDGLRYVSDESQKNREQTPCATSTPVPRLSIVADADREIPLEGGAPAEGCNEEGVDRLSKVAHDALVRETHGCEGNARSVHADVQGGQCVTWDCRVPYISCVREGGRFWSTWGGEQFDCAGPPSRFGDAEVVWRFLNPSRPDPPTP